MAAYALIGCLYQSLIIPLAVKIKTITYQRVKNLGNYESERLEMSCDVDEDEDPILAAAQLQQDVYYLLFKPAEKDIEQDPEPEPGENPF